MKQKSAELNSLLVRLSSLERRSLQRALLALRVLLLVTTLIPQPSHASLLSILEDLSSAGSKGARVGETTAARAGGTALSTARRAAMAAEMLASAGAAAYLTVAGDDVLLYLAGVQSPARLLSDAANLTNGVGARLRPGQRLVMDSILAEHLGAESGSLAERYQLAVADPHFGIRPVVRFDAGSARYLVEIRPGLAVPLEAAAMSEDVWAMLSAKPPFEKIRLMAMVSHGDPDALARLLDVGGDRIDVSTAGATGRVVLDAYRDGVVIMIGHVEADAFVLTSGLSAPVRVQFADIEAEATRVNATVLYVGCETFGSVTGSGYLRAVRDLEVASALKRALAAQTYGDLLGGLATPGNPFVINPGSLRREAGRLILSAQRLHEHEALVNRGATGVRLSSQVVATVIAADSLLTVFGSLYGMGILAALISFRQSWATYDRLYPRLPNRMRSPLGFFPAYTLKLFVFVLLLPVSTAWVAAFILIGGGWAQREHLFAFFWSFFLKPLSFLETVLAWSFLTIAWLLLMFGSSLPLLLGLFMLHKTSEGAHVMFGVVGLIVTAGGIWALIAMWRQKPMAIAEALMMAMTGRVRNMFVRMLVLAFPVAALVALMMSANPRP